LTGIIGRETPPLFLLADIQLLSTFAVALAEGFEEDYAGGYADVEGFYGARGWQRDSEVAVLAGSFVGAFAFAAPDAAGGRGVIDIGVAFSAVSSRPTSQ
jgi:hypothetical protein